LNHLVHARRLIKYPMSKALSFCLAVAVVVSLVGCTETHEAYYPTYEAAVAAGAISHGWIPHWLPKSAVEIREKHDLDTNQSMLTFRYGTEQLAFEKDCTQVDPFNPKEPPFKVSWWPTDVPASRFSTYRHVFYSCEGGQAFLALLPSSTEVFYWRP
jgi:hypothetical protein